MVEDDRARWDERYADGDWADIDEPAEILNDAEAWLDEPGLALRHPDALADDVDVCVHRVSPQSGDERHERPDRQETGEYHGEPGAGRKDPRFDVRHRHPDAEPERCERLSEV